jgi:hypothetical protein
MSTVVATTEQQQIQQQIQQQLERLLSDPLFRNSKRYPDLLRYVVEQTLQGHADTLKERTLGVAVFHRKPDYDSNADPVVRITAGEVRKRLAQYYTQEEHRGELRIDLPSGSYIPEFRQPPPGSSPALAGKQEGAPSTATTTAQDASSASHRRWSGWVAATLVLLAAMVLLGIREARRPHNALPTSLRSFWSPLLQSHSPILLCVGSAAVALPVNPDPTIAAHPLASNPVTFSDAVTLTRLAGFLEANHKSFLMLPARTASFADLQRTPSILIAGFDNPWTVRLTDPLRFHFVQRGGSISGIEDRLHPDNRTWNVDFQAPYAHLTMDYGILARFHDRLTDQQVVVAAGIGEDGTAAASSLALNAEYMAQLLHDLHGDPAHTNLEVVFSTEVIDGNPGPPRVVAATQW